MPDHCTLCERSREASSDLCNFHSTAIKKLEDAYPLWNKAYDGKLTKEEFYTKLLNLPETGRTVKLLIEHVRGSK